METLIARDGPRLSIIQGLLQALALERGALARRQGGGLAGRHHLQQLVSALVLHGKEEPVALSGRRLQAGDDRGDPAGDQVQRGRLDGSRDRGVEGAELLAGGVAGVLRPVQALGDLLVDDLAEALAAIDQVTDRHRQLAQQRVEACPFLAEQLGADRRASRAVLDGQQRPRHFLQHRRHGAQLAVGVEDLDAEPLEGLDLGLAALAGLAEVLIEGEERLVQLFVGNVRLARGALKALKLVGRDLEPARHGHERGRRVHGRLVEVDELVDDVVDLDSGEDADRRRADLGQGGADLACLRRDAAQPLTRPRRFGRGVLHLHDAADDRVLAGLRRLAERHLEPQAFDVAGHGAYLLLRSACHAISRLNSATGMESSADTGRPR